MPDIVKPQLRTYDTVIKEERQIKMTHIVRNYCINFLKIANYLNQNPIRGEGLTGYICKNLVGYNKLIAKIGCNTQIIKNAYEYGLLDTIYTSDGTELKVLPEEIYLAAKRFIAITKATLIFVRFYVAMAEITDEKIYDPIIIVKMGLTQNMIIPETNEVQPDIQFEDLKEFTVIKRIMGLRSIYDELKFIADHNVNIWLYICVEPHLDNIYIWVGL